MSGAAFEWDSAQGTEERARNRERRSGAIAEGQKTNMALALSLLQVIGPYNTFPCANCGVTVTGGSHCAQCGHSVSFAST